MVAFAAETENLLEYARDKRIRKGADLIVANDVSRTDVGFGSEQNEVTILGPGDSDAVHVPAQSKRAVAARIPTGIAIA